jgi:hypothetical protein
MVYNYGMTKWEFHLFLDSHKGKQYFVDWDDIDSLLTNCRQIVLDQKLFKATFDRTPQNFYWGELYKKMSSGLN